MQHKIKLDKISNFIGDIKEDSDSTVERKALGTRIALQPDEEKTFIAKISTINVDRDGDIIIPTGADITDFSKNSVVLFDHSYSSPPVGKVLDLQFTSDAILARIKMADTTVANELWSLVKGGFLTTNSIGFIVKEALIAGTSAFRDYVSSTGLRITDKVKRIITKFTLLETSLVSLPANQDALILAVSNKSITLSDKLLKDFHIEAKSTEPVVTQPVTTVVPSAPVVEPIAVQPVIEKTPESVATQVVTEVPKVAPVTPIWNVIRSGPYKADAKDLQISKSLKMGKIV